MLIFMKKVPSREDIINPRLFYVIHPTTRLHTRKPPRYFRGQDIVKPQQGRQICLVIYANFLILFFLRSGLYLVSIFGKSDLSLVYIWKKWSVFGLYSNTDQMVLRPVV